MLLQKILLEKRSRWQVIGANIGIFVGLFLLLFALQFYTDMRILMRGAKDANLLIINKDLSILNTLGAPADFSDTEYEEVKNQSFIKSADRFISNQYRSSISIPDFNFYSLLFFQSIPNSYLGIKNAEKFTWSPGQEVPIVVSSDYLALYNFGFAPSQNLPQLTITSMRLLAVDLNVSGKGKTQTFKARLYDLSPNVNSILVPAEFMEFANLEFGEKIQPTNQLILSVQNPYDKNLNDFLKQKNYKISRGGLIGGELKTVLDLLILVVLVVALLLIGLSLLVFVLNFQLLVTQAQQEIRLLLQLGYTQKILVQILARNLLVSFAAVTLLTFLILSPVKYWLSSALINQGYAQISVWLHLWVWVVGLIFASTFAWLNWISIRKSVNKVA
jgi:hypothetical protein